MGSHPAAAAGWREERAVKVFLSYRRADVGGYAGRLGDALIEHLGAKSVFQDVTAIRAGQDFVLAIDRALEECDAVLAVIGPGWLTASTPDGVSRLLDPGDFVHMELSRALELDVPVIPVLVGNAELPRADDLPPELAKLPQRQAVVLHDPTWHQDIEGLVRSLRGEPPVPTKHRRWWLVGLTAAIVLAATAGAVWWRAAVTTGSGATGTTGSGRTVIGGYTPAQDDKPACPDPSGWTPIALGDNPTGTVEAEGGSLTFTVKAGYWRPLGPGKWQVILDTAMTNHTGTPYQQQSGNYKDLVVANRPFYVTCIGVKDVTFVSPRRTGDGRVGFEVGCRPAGAIDLDLQFDDNHPLETVQLTTTSKWSGC